jgi:hypothetical protein
MMIVRRTSLTAFASLLTLLGVGASSVALGQAAGTVPQTSESIYRSAYFQGRGDTGIATADDQDAIFYNPAGIAQGKGIYKKTVLLSPQIEVSQSTRDLAQQLANKNDNTVNTVEDHIGKPNHLGVSNFTGLILRRAALGVVTSSNVDLLAYDDPNSGGLEAVHAMADSTAGVTFSLADKVFSDKLMVGVTTKYLERGRGDIAASAADYTTVQDKLKDPNNFIAKGTGAGADLGVMYHAGGRLNPSFGATVDDVGNTKIHPDAATTMDLDLKQTVNLGVSIEPGTRTSHFKLLADYHDATGAVEKDWRKRTHLGSELEVVDLVGVTAGLNQGYPTCGFYLDMYLARLDLGMYTEEMGDRAGTRPDERFFLRLTMGF